MKTVAASDLIGGNATANAAEFIAILGGQGNRHLVDIVVLNAAFALSLVKTNSSLEQAISTVRTALADAIIETFFQNFRQFVMSAKVNK
jgi:anthranilate phosphoribosyltransferase